ncbi:uncharacterized protein BX664DRAFT_33544 [Halteromyces radiatus]|uniref:uncharacterized protein n=1 Tax=Halteromyces radiatus TaxID=101107 RepID=UPI00221FF387|nr:uncharacterized protein BX664DRAFT_33544 [Halteromyces radiatus]KAI8100095.1 hypothetical protein BX664DRAFT_33544 [Halteromyces radiatus]
MASKEQQAATLINQLAKTTNEYDDEQSLSLCDQLISLQGENDILPLHCKVITLIRLEKYNEALSLISRKFRDNKTVDLTFEKLYCYYRTNQWQQAFDLLSSIKTNHSNSSSLRFLEAQLLYGQDKFQPAIDIYEALLQETDEHDPLYEEIQVNLLAARTGLAFDTPETQEVSDLITTTSSGYEVTYNAASIQLAQGNYTRAAELLELARKQCNDRLKDQDMAHDELDDELAVIATQLAYTYQTQGRVKEAMDIYQDIVASKIDDTAVNAVVANNLMTLQKTDDLFDSAKKIKVATGKDADTKLKQYQKRIISMNEALLQMFMNKHGSCKEIIQRLIKQYPNMDELYLILTAATYHQQEKADKALDELKAIAKQHPKSLAIRFATIQLELLSSQPASALKTLENYMDQVQDDKEAHRPAVVALLVWLYEQTGQAEKAMKTLDQASNYWKQHHQHMNSNLPSLQSSSHSATPSILKQTAAFKLKTGRFQEAALDYEQLVKADPTDIQAIAGLISAYADIDPVKAEQYGETLPVIASDASLNVDELENVVPGVKKGYVKKDPSSGHIKKPRNKKKRSPLLPKNYDESKTPDPERWMPARDRSTYRAKGKAKKAATRGPQGMAMEGGGIGTTGSARIAGRTVESPSSPTTEDIKPVASSETSPAATKATSSSKNTNKSNKKKKKGGKNKW